MSGLATTPCILMCDRACIIYMYHKSDFFKSFDEGCTAQTQGTELQTMLNVLEMNLNEHVLLVEEQR